MAIRIMHVVNSLGKGGLENGLVNLINGLDPDRFHHVVCTLRGGGPNAERLSRNHVQILSLDCKGWGARVQTPALVRAIRSVQPDIVHSRNWSAIEAVFAARLARTPGIIHSEHGFEADAAAPEPWRRKVLRRSAFEMAHQVVSVSLQLREVHASRTGFSAHRIAVIHNGVDCVAFSPDGAARGRLRTELGIDDGDFCIGCVANLLPVKDHMTLLRAVETFAVACPRWRLVLVGEGTERETLQRFVAQRPGWQSRVLFLGSSGRVPDLLRPMDVFVMPSVAEGICNSLLEAMASGVAVVATAVGGNPEVVIHGESGLLFAARDVRGLANHLAELHSFTERRQALAAAGVLRVKKAFSLDSMIQAYDGVYCRMRPATGAPVLSHGYQ